MKVIIRFIIAVLVLIPTSANCEVVDRIIAIVNDDIITLKELESFVGVEKRNRFTSIDEYLRNLQMRDKLDMLIDGVLIKQQAKKLKIFVSDEEMKAIIEGIKKQNLIEDSELREQLKKENITYENFVEGVRINVLSSRVLSRVVSQDVKVTDAILRSYYEEHKKDFSETEYGLKQIFISGQRNDAAKRAAEIHKKLEQGKAFEEAASEFSDDASASQGGDIGFVKADDLLPSLREAVKLLSPNTYSTAIATPYGFHILKLLSVKGSEILPFESVKEKVHQQIVIQESDKRYKGYMNKLRESSYIEVKI